MEFWHYGWFTTVLVVPADIDLKLPFFFRKHFVRPKWECEDFWSNLTFCPICIQQRLLPPHVQFKTIRMRGRVFRSSHSEMSSHSLLVRRQVLALVPLCAHTLTHHTPTHSHTTHPHRHTKGIKRGLWPQRGLWGHISKSNSGWTMTCASVFSAYI